MSKVDWSKAPIGAEAYADGKFYKSKKFRVYYFKDNDWWLSGYSSISLLSTFADFETVSQQWPESDERIDIVGTNGNDGEHYQQEPTKTAADFLSEGLRILSERGKQYGSEGNERSFAQVAQAFTAVTGKQLVGSDICLILALVKQVRQYAQPRYHHDSAVDGVNYVALQAEELQKERA